MPLPLADFRKESGLSLTILWNLSRAVCFFQIQYQRFLASSLLLRLLRLQQWRDSGCNRYPTAGHLPLGGIFLAQERASRDATEATFACDAAKAASWKNRLDWIEKKQTSLDRGDERINEIPSIPKNGRIPFGKLSQAEIGSNARLIVFLLAPSQGESLDLLRPRGPKQLVLETSAVVLQVG